MKSQNNNRKTVLPAAFYNRPTLEVARELLGCQLCREGAEGTLRWPITETEAYDGPDDRASHARAGRTQRTRIMFGHPGIWYIYLCYGIHWMLNIVTGPEGYPAAILIRGAGCCQGPGRLTKALHITGKENGLPAQPASRLWIEAGHTVSDNCVQRTPRIGIDYAGPDWAKRHYRFIQTPENYA